MREGVLSEVPERALQFVANGWQFGHADEQFVVLEEVGELSGVDVHVHGLV